jgi:hypothetical protein
MAVLRVGVVLNSYRLHPEPTHMNAPNAWMVERNGEMIAHGISLADALEEIRFDAEPLPENPIEAWADYLIETGRIYC